MNLIDASTYLLLDVILWFKILTKEKKINHSKVTSVGITMNSVKLTHSLVTYVRLTHS